MSRQLDTVVLLRMLGSYLRNISIDFVNISLKNRVCTVYMTQIHLSNSLLFIGYVWINILVSEISSSLSARRFIMLRLCLRDFFE